MRLTVFLVLSLSVLSVQAPAQQTKTCQIGFLTPRRLLQWKSARSFRRVLPQRS
jgi:hypothetical protein